MQNSPLLEGFDFTNCVLLGNSSLEYMNRLSSIRALNLACCSQITDKGLAGLQHALPRIERLSLEDVHQLTDDGMQFIVQHCTKLIHLNLNGCHQVTVVPVLQIVRNNRFLTHLQLSKVVLIDDGLVDLSNLLQHLKLVELNISYCSAITDIGVTAIAETCSSVRILNLSGLNRVTFRSLQQITTRCWDLQTLHLQDIFLATDKIFHYEAAIDGRAASNERMLASLQRLSCTDCVALTDRGLLGVAERCRRLEHLTLRGCSKITDGCLVHFSDDSLNPTSKFSLAAALISLDLSFCPLLTKTGLETVLRKCQSLNELNLSGLVSTVDDACLRMISRACPTIQVLKVKQCVLLTDMALCHIVDGLWLESIDLSGCHRITDHGIEVLGEAFTGLQSIMLNKLKHVTTKAVRFLQQTCKGLRLVECQECPLVSFDDVNLDQWNLEILH